ncbi:ATP-dependent zinc metalloprotease FTSH, putative [Plasmodium malariae]|uniref:ATP-dependent zinc metalloprotease FTSH, putative n=2 Tax=Plasmodium malariae TaxID=5858 RepID=A0A1D3PBM8_PLAMA|nr:ATP-dependent zinc metalloprotease FTSH, putative [Plasmodium malariae]SCN12716.1 ATP-dependent zinc metalloprotease FTSH, putative [Plasmodium malariae]
MLKMYVLRRGRRVLYNEKRPYNSGKYWGGIERLKSIMQHEEGVGKKRFHSSLICIKNFNKGIEKEFSGVAISNEKNIQNNFSLYSLVSLLQKKWCTTGSRNNTGGDNKELLFNIFLKYAKMNHMSLYFLNKYNFGKYEKHAKSIWSSTWYNTANGRRYNSSCSSTSNDAHNYMRRSDYVCFKDKIFAVRYMLNILVHMCRERINKSPWLIKRSMPFCNSSKVIYDRIPFFSFLRKIYFSKAPKGFERFEKKNASPNSFKPEEDKHKKFDNYFFYVFFLLLLLFLLFVDSNSLYNEVSQNDFFYNYLAKGYIEKIKLINKDYVKAYLNSHGVTKYHLKYISFRIGNSDSFERKVEEMQKQMNIKREELIEVQYMNETNLLNEVKSYIPSILFFLLLIFIFQKITLKNVSNSGMDRLFKFSKITPINKNNYKTDVKFSSVAGMKQAKEEIMEFVDFLKNPSKYEILGAKIPKGALLCGAPGTGKTLLAKAVAGEANVPFFNISGSDFIEVFVGIGPSRVRELFAQARKHAPSIIFIDEIDAVGRKRSKGGFAGGGNDERENTLNQMLVEMDGFHTSNDKVVILAGTNRVDILDPAITRPGRFDRIVNISKPDIDERSEIFQVHLKNLKLHETLDIKNISYILASLTPGFVGADIANVVNEGAIQCARRSNMIGVQVKDFELAIERVIGGLPKSSSLISPYEKKIISYHETGHALIGWFLEFADPVLKVSIIPRNNGALGYSQHLSEEIMLFSKEQILDKIAVILGGRASEELFIGKITTGAIDDLNKVTQLCYSYVSQYGMNKEIGLVSFQPNSTSEYNLYRPHSECLAHQIDNEVRTLIESQYNRVKTILLKNEKHVHNLANLLYQKETISYQDIQKCVGERPYPIKSNYEKFVKANPYKLIPSSEDTQSETSQSETSQSSGGNRDGSDQLTLSSLDRCCNKSDQDGPGVTKKSSDDKGRGAVSNKSVLAKSNGISEKGKEEEGGEVDRAEREERDEQDERAEHVKEAGGTKRRRDDEKAGKGKSASPDGTKKDYKVLNISTI